MWNAAAVWAVAVKDMRAIFANIQVWLPMAIIPAIVGVILPAAVLLVLRFKGAGSMQNADQILQYLERLPASPLRQAVESLPALEQRLAYLMANFLFAPLFLLIPLMAASVISAASFAGEKERGTPESLLLAPVNLMSLLTGKVLAALLPSVGLSLATFLNVFISARVSTFQAAHQMGGLVVLPVIALLFGQVTGVLLLDTAVMVVLGPVLAALALVLLRVIVVRLDRGHLFESRVR